MARLALHGVAKRFGSAPALQGIDLEVDDGELLVLVGPSGCGKSTLLRLIAGLARPDEGRILIDGRSVEGSEPRDRNVAMVFQGYALYPHMSVRANLAFPLKLARRPRAEVERRVHETASLLGLQGLLERKPAELSGGQMQRVAVGRALVRDPRLFLFDEPLSNLDPGLRDELRAELRRLHERLRITTLYVTHDQAEAMTLGTRLCVMNAGRIEQVGSPREVFDRPRTAFVARFIGSPPMNLLRARVSDGRLLAGSVELPPAARLRSGARDGDELLYGIRPHEVEWGGAIEVAVRSLEDFGDRVQVECELAGQRLLVTRHERAALAPGARVGIGWSTECVHAFEAASGLRLDRSDAP